MASISGCTIHSQNPDGSAILQVPDKDAYFNEVTNELLSTYEKYSDVKIVCKNGVKINANKAMLSRIPRLSEYLRLPEIQTGHETWLFLPEINSEWMILILNGLYGKTLNPTDLENPELKELQKLLGLFHSELFENVVVELKSESESYWDIICEDGNPGEYARPLRNETPMGVQIHNHLRETVTDGISDKNIRRVSTQSKPKSSKVAHLSNEPILQIDKTSHTSRGENFAEDNDNRIFDYEPPESWDWNEIALSPPQPGSRVRNPKVRKPRAKKIQIDKESPDDLVFPEQNDNGTDHVPPFLVCRNGLKSKDRKKFTQKLHKAITWRRGLRLDPTPGYVYVFKGEDTDLASICEADQIAWRHKGNRKAYKDQETSATHFVAIPDVLKMTSAEQLSFGTDVIKDLSIRKLDFGAISYKKRITRVHSTNLYIIEYNGDQTILPWKEKSNFSK